MPKLTKQQIDGLKKTKDPQLRQRYFFLFSHPAIRQVLSSPITSQTVEKIVSQHGLNNEQHGKLSEIIVKIFTGQIDSNKIEDYLAEQLKTPANINKEINHRIQRRILAPIKQELDKAYQEMMTPGFVKPEKKSSSKEIEAPSPAAPPTPDSNIPSPLAERLAPDRTPENSPTVPTETPDPLETEPSQDIRSLAKQNPGILEQQITANYLKESGTDQSLPPTVKNWLLDYTKVAGSTKHSSLDRGRYLFKSPNAKSLSDRERQILGQILESYDEGVPVKINPETGLIDLPKRHNDFRPQRSDEVRTFQVQPISFGNIVDLQDL